MKDLINYTPIEVATAVRDVYRRTEVLNIPKDGGPHNLNHINLAAYLLLKECLYELAPKEIGFLGNLTKVNSVSLRQRAWLKALLKKHLSIDIDGEGIQQELELVA